MTTTTPVLQPWASQPMGKAARIAIATGGLVLATLVLMTATIVPSGSWAMIALGIVLAPSAIRAARIPTPTRLLVLGVSVLAIPLTIQFL
ncbi:MAG: hypothetical protein WCE80_03685 [Acidimicrobiia bacterium]